MPGTEFANLEFFVEDAIYLLEILRTPNPPVPYDETHPFFQLNQLHFNSWSFRCRNCLKSFDNHCSFIDWQDYICALCDALFGIWPTEVNEINIFHTATDKPVTSTQVGFHRECIRSILSFYNSTASSINSIDYHVFDASYIETCGPFRFKATKTLARHLTITHNNEILYYADWRKWAFLAWHRVLHEASMHNRLGNNVSFDTLTNMGRMRKQEVGYSPAVIRISQDILMMNLLCFHQRSLTNRQSKQSAFPANLFRHLRPKSSEDIGRRIGLELSESEALDQARAFIGSHSEDWGSLLNSCMPFTEREIKLHKTLKEWRPKTVWEMRYSGYGGVDPVGLYAFYFASLFGVIAIIGLGVSAAQAYAGFKGLHIPSVP
jgi:hypothetical protein